LSGSNSQLFLSEPARHKPPVQFLAGNRGPHRVQWRWLAAHVDRFRFRRLFRLDAAHLGCDASVIYDRHRVACFLAWRCLAPLWRGFAEE
jgi:hypothetical protein